MFGYGTGIKSLNNPSHFTVQTWGAIFIHENQFLSGCQSKQTTFIKICSALNV